MNAPDRPDADRPTLFCLHFLGGSARTWEWTTSRLAGSFRCVTIDLPGFGDAAGIPGYTIADMADHVADAIRAEAPRRWILAGHSMGAKLAAVLARRAEDGEPGLSGLSHLVLLAGSPPGPEPMDESQRQAMMGWFAADPDARRAEAQGYIDQNVGATLDVARNAQAVADVLRLERAAWLAWLEHGSREDWSARVGVLRTPALIVAGADDAALGPDAQRERMAPHFAEIRLVTLPGAAHLLPLERPDEVARLIVEHAASAGQAAHAAPAIGAAYLALINSDRVGARTRETLLARARADDPAYQAAAMTMAQMTTLRAVVDRVLPQPAAGPGIDLGARIDRLLASGEGDGWRYALLPTDPEAYRAALRTLDQTARAAHGLDFAALDGSGQDEMLRRAAAGCLDTGATGQDLLDARQMQLWFEDLRSDAVRLYVAHPATLARMGYGGIAYGGDGERKPGFVRIRAGEREAWEPVAEADVEAGATP